MRTPINPDISDPEALWKRINRYIEHEGKCWIWRGALTRDGYGQIQVKDLTKGWVQFKVHRLTYLLSNEPFPMDKQIHHKCHVRACCNPAHLEPMTHREHTDQHLVSHCKYGHELIGENLYIQPDGRRRCKQCRARRSKKYAEANPEKMKALHKRYHETVRNTPEAKAAAYARVKAWRLANPNARKAEHVRAKERKAQQTQV